MSGFFHWSKNVKSVPGSIFQNEQAFTTAIHILATHPEMATITDLLFHLFCDIALKHSS